MRRAAEGLGAAKKASERVIVSLRHGVRFVIMTARAGDGHTHKSAGGDIDLIIEPIHDELLILECREIDTTEREHPSADDVLMPLGVRFRRQQISGDLLSDESRVGLIGIE